MYKIQKINYDYQYYLSFNGNVNYLFLNYFTIYFIFLVDVLNLLNLFFFKKKFVQEKILNQFLKNILVIEGRIKKENSVQFAQFLNISEFVCSKQKEIYLNSYKRFSFFIKNNLVLQKKFIDDKFYFFKLNKIFNTYFVKIKSLGNIFFVQYRIYGLGFRIKKSSVFNGRSLRFEIGFGHGIYYKLPLQIKCLKRKRRFLFYSSNLQYLVFLKNHINNLKLLNPYKIRGLKDLKYNIKMKKGKKQSKK